MKIEVFWDNEEHTIIQSTYKRGWTWDEFREANLIAREMLAGVTHTVHMIANFESGAFPPMGALGRFKSAQDTLPKDTVIVVVGGGIFINTLVTTYTRAYRSLSRNLITASSLQDARKKIAHLSERLPAN